MNSPKLPAVDPEVALQDVTDWLDKRKIFPGQREKGQDQIDILVEAVSQGILVINPEDNSIEHKLIWPLENKEKVVTLASLKYSGRLNDNMMRPHTAGLKPGDSDGRLLAYIAGLTGVVRGVLVNLDSQDKRIAMAISIFFL